MFLQENEVGSIAFMPLAQGLLTNKYLNGIPTGSRAAKEKTFLSKEQVHRRCCKSREKAKRACR